MFNHIYSLKFIKLVRLVILLTISIVSLAAVFLCEVSVPAVSHPSGFYKENFELVLSAPVGTEIYYTIDGSVPNINSQRYTEPIYISDRSKEPNLHSMRTDVSAGFYTDLIQKYETWDEAPGYQTPDYLLDKCTVIRAIAVNSVGIISNELSVTYFVGISPEVYDGCNIISLITDPDNLFSKDKGIYVTGEMLETYLQRKDFGKSWSDEYWRFWEANYRQRGKDWERDAILHFFDAEGELLLSKKCGMRVHGGVSRATLPRSLNLYARAEYDHSDVFEADIFGSGFYPHSITLNAGGNQLITQFNDYMITEKVRNRNFTTQLFSPYVLFINGEYWGFYWMSEKYDEMYLKYYYGVEENNCVIIKNGELEVGKDSDWRIYEKMVSFISANDMAIEENYEKACNLIDIDSFLDYFATMYYIARSEDWPGGNYAMWRSRSYGESPYADTKWRWMMFDCNSSCMSTYIGWDMTDYNTLEICKYDPLFASLWENESFRADFCERVFEIGTECFDGKEMEKFIQHYMVEMEPILEKSWTRFYGSQNEKRMEYRETLKNIQNFFLDRGVYVKNWLSEYIE